MVAGTRSAFLKGILLRRRIRACLRLLAIGSLEKSGLGFAQQPDRQRDHRCYECQHSADCDPDHAEREQQEPDDRIENQR
jgi:hypothetical protein